MSDAGPHNLHIPQRETPAEPSSPNQETSNARPHDLGMDQNKVPAQPPSLERETSDAGPYDLGTYQGEIPPKKTHLLFLSFLLPPVVQPARQLVFLAGFHTVILLDTDKHR
jgi:hypothetical protein